MDPKNSVIMRFQCMLYFATANSVIKLSESFFLNVSFKD